jgi:hypothetical protein
MLEGARLSFSRWSLSKSCHKSNLNKAVACDLLIAPLFLLYFILLPHFFSLACTLQASWYVFFLHWSLKVRFHWLMWCWYAFYNCILEIKLWIT